jgi:hypothetical protein
MITLPQMIRILREYERGVLAHQFESRNGRRRMIVGTSGYKIESS